MAQSNHNAGPVIQTVCLCMIVKNEAPVIARCLENARPLISHWAIVDTGSTDGTQDIIRKVMAPKLGKLVEEPPIPYADTGFFDYAANRNRALVLKFTYWWN